MLKPVLVLPLLFIGSLALAAQESLQSAVTAIGSLKETQNCGSIQASLETEPLDGEYFSQRQVQFLKIVFQNPYGQENVIYSKGDIKIEHSGKIGGQRETISFSLDPLREQKGGAHDGVAAEIIHDGKGKLIDLRVLETTAYLGSKSDSEWKSVCKKR